ncbi:unnamed protein product [Paramecium sonneborni]|uniref:Transmembrane protein n=1 Tax=Paramecium sonneborni TaxID=65129 RepID=A0A8S1RJK6_9CILI|nr:unnamed protein product [Paramecium sonneborni]
MMQIFILTLPYLKRLLIFHLFIYIILIVIQKINKDQKKRIIQQRIIKIKVERPNNWRLYYFFLNQIFMLLKIEEVYNNVLNDIQINSKLQCILRCIQINYSHIYLKIYAGIQILLLMSTIIRFQGN